MFSLTQNVLAQQNRSESNIMSKTRLYKRQLLPVQDAVTLLSSDQSKRLLGDIRRALQAPDEAFNAYCLPLIHAVAELVQRLPCSLDIEYKKGAITFFTGSLWCNTTLISRLFRAKLCS